MNDSQPNHGRITIENRAVRVFRVHGEHVVDDVQLDVRRDVRLDVRHDVDFSVGAKFQHRIPVKNY